MKIRTYMRIAITLVVLLLFFIILGIFNRDVLNITGNLSSVLTALFTIITAFLLYLTFNNQRETFAKQQVESRFFELLKMQRENSSEINFAYPNYNYKGKKALECIITDLKNCLFLANAYYGHTNSNLICCELNTNKEKEISEKVINLGYISFYFGRQPSGLLNNILSGIKGIDLKIYHEFFDKAPVDYKGVLDEIPNSGGIIPFANGYRSQLSHYMRHLFQTVNYINERKDLTYKEKYSYIKTLRAQLSDEEQFILFCNSISTLGEMWEKCETIKDENSMLITKYKLLKNLPSKYFTIKNFEINIKKFYPEIYYEDDTGDTFKARNNEKTRKELEKRYS